MYPLDPVIAILICSQYTNLSLVVTPIPTPVITQTPRATSMKVTPKQRKSTNQNRNSFDSAEFSFRGTSIVLPAAQLQAFGKLTLKKVYKLGVLGCADPNSRGKPNGLKISLKCASIIKWTLTKMHSKRNISIVGKGILKNPKCANSNNNCVVFQETKGR